MRTLTCAGLSVGLGPTKNRPEKILAGHTCPRPFSYLFYVASKPAGSNDHEIDVVIRSARLPVKASKRLPSLVRGRGQKDHDDQGHSARPPDRRACEERWDSSRARL